MQKWGIWGLGIVGKSAVQYLYKKGYALSVYDDRELSKEELRFLELYQVALYTDLRAFCTDNDHIVPSPGVSIAPAKDYAHKIVSELDLFFTAWGHGIMAVTGSLGKTTLVNVLHQILTAHKKPCSLAGNIGHPMLDLLRATPTGPALLEVSSFQLEHTKKFKPDLAVLTNFYPNHLDRHGNLANYFKAKYQLFQRLTSQDKAVVPLSTIYPFREQSKQPMIFFSTHYPTMQEMELLVDNDLVYVLEGDHLAQIHSTMSQRKVSMHKFRLAPSTLEHVSVLLPDTRVLVLTLCDILGLDVESHQLISKPFELPGHRIEFLGAHKNTLFYNDSKATIIEATISAAASLNKPIHLIMGGLSKGIARKDAVERLEPFIRSVTCFGKEAVELHEACLVAGIASSSHQTLDQAFNAAVSLAQPGEVVLLSPAGSSYDLYSNYEERGAHFRSLVEKLKLSKEQESS